MKKEGRIIVDYTRGMVSTVNGVREVMTGEMRTLMKNGIKRNLVPLNQFEKPLLKFDRDTKSMISFLNNSIKFYEKNIYNLELEKSLAGRTTSEIAEIDAEIEHLQFEICKTQSKIRDIKAKFYKNQASTIDLDA